MRFIQDSKCGSEKLDLFLFVQDSVLVTRFIGPGSELAKFRFLVKTVKGPMLGNFHHSVTLFKAQSLFVIGIFQSKQQFSRTSARPLKMSASPSGTPNTITASSQKKAM